MVAQVTLKDGTTRLVARLFTVLDRGPKGRERKRYVAQRVVGAKLRWYRPRELKSVVFEMEPGADDAPAPTPERSAG